MKKYLFLGAFLLGLLYTYSQDGSLDPSFASKGWATTSFFKSANKIGGTVIKVFVQSDGKYVAVIQFYFGTTLARYNANGTLDLTFGTEGFSDPISMNANSAVKQSDGKIVVAGSAYNVTAGNEDIALARFTSNGTLDLTFGTNGMATADFGGEEEAKDVALQSSSGKILVTGNIGNGNFTAIRYNSSGTQDKDFGTGGMAIADFGGDDFSLAIAVDGSDNFAVAGSSYTTLTQFAVARYAVDGSPDGSFSGDGMVTTDVGGNNSWPSWATSIAIQSDGKIIAAGQANNQVHNGYDFALVRYTAAGALDASFGVGGITTTDVTNTADFHTVDAHSLSLGNGTILVGGSYLHLDATSNYLEDFVLVRYLNNGTNDGTPDPDFGTSGIKFTDLNVYDDLATTTVQSDGKIIAAGGSNSDNYNYFSLIRYTADGSLDPDFNTTGTLLGYYSPGGQSMLNGISVQKDGKVVVAGFGFNPDYQLSLGLARYNTNGTLDNTFGTGGKASTDFGENFPINNYYQPVSVAIQADGKIVVGLQVDNNTTHNSDFALARFTASGTLDVTFGTGGKVTSGFSGVLLYYMAVQSDGKIVAAGQAYDPNPSGDFALVRYTASGAPDNTFGTGGKVVTDFFGGIDNGYGVAIQSDGKIVVAGSAYNPTSGNSDFALARYTTLGRLDVTFGTRGKVTTDFGSDDFSGPLVLQSDGKIVVLGGTGSDNPDFALARYNTNGTLDNTFGTGGKVTTRIGDKEFPSSIALQSDGKIVVAGTVENFTSNGNYYLTLVRYTTSGALDNTFGTGGIATTDFYNSDFYPIAWNNGRIYAAGRIIDYFSYNDAGLLAAFKAGPTSTLPVVNITDTDVYRASSTTTTPATLTISSTGTISSSSPITVNYATQDGTATSKGRTPDYKSTRGSIVLTSTAPSVTISIPVNATAFNATTLKSFTVNLSLSRQMSSLATIGKGIGVVTIIPISTLASPVTTFNKLQVQEEQGKLSVKVYPNPSASYFTLQLQSASTAPVSIRVTDVLGRMVEAKAGLAANSTVQFGHTYVPGVYYAQVLQGRDKATVQLIKQKQ